MTLKIFQHGCLGTRNYGDERSAQIVRENIREWAPDTEFFVVGSSLEHLQRFHGDATEVSVRSDEEKVFELLEKSDLMIYGPGTMLGGIPMPKTLEYIKAGPPFIIWGSGAWNEAEEGSDGAKVIEAAAKIGVRDRFALEVVQQHRNDVQLVGDPMCFDRRTDLKRDFNAVCISSHLSRSSAKEQTKVLETLAGAMTALGGVWIAVPASWDAVSTHDNDGIFHKQLAEIFPDLILHEKDSSSGWDDITEGLGRVKLMITSRLHTGVPVVAGGGGVVYFGQDKNRDMSEMLGDKGLFGGFYATMTTDTILRAASKNPSPNREAFVLRSLRSKRILRQWIEEVVGCESS